MSRNSLTLKIVALSGVLLIPVSALSQTSNEYAQMAKATWSAFECSSLASKARLPDEQERLFRFGYEQGKSFISALLDQKIAQEDLSQEAPTILLLLLQGPTPDFMLGRIYESAQESALEGIYRTGDISYDDEEQQLNAENKFSRLNCNLIGN
ncbi:hypothetical protein [Pseudohongiella spirulinae]|uniref:Uncharacterized protein n=1 Tax=Pseudohongiella spirulinae TaxID=1249552 RepID=A0A0S2K9C2_9GAMM|nr:hypothetical protein [Pseudohongiella spirulinae]ALO44924.1 hypothetical protein PS2015_231 [Pseudohongiella spirulinae]